MTKRRWPKCERMFTAGEWVRMIWDAVEKQEGEYYVSNPVRALSNCGSAAPSLWDDRRNPHW